MSLLITVENWLGAGGPESPRLMIFGTVVAFIVSIAMEIQILREESRLYRMLRALNPSRKIRASIQLSSAVWMAFSRRREFSDPPCRSLRQLSGWIPGPKLRKRVLKMLADQDREITELLDDERTGAAARVYCCTWGLFFFMVLTGPVVSLRNVLFSRRSA
jgi:hypothetical protein